MLRVALSAIFFTLLLCPLSAEEKSYSDGHGGRVVLPAGDLSFADEVVSFDKHSPFSYKNSLPQKALGVHDRKSLSLSCGGSVVLAFTDNALMDIEGDDLHIFEVGPRVEPTSLALSRDGEQWIEIGEVAGGKASIDIAPYVKKGEVFRFVRLTDLKSACKGDYPGADIDAVAAIGSSVKLSLSSAVLFDTGKYQLKNEAHDAIHKLLQTITSPAQRSVVVEGHTDNQGDDNYNNNLSLNRAKSVKEYLVTTEGFLADHITIKGYGESQPIASNETIEGRSENRRVEIVIAPSGE